MKVSTDSNILEITVDVLSEKQSRIRKFIQRYKDTEKCRIKAFIQRYKSMEQSIKQRETRLERRDQKREPQKKKIDVCQGTILCSNEIVLQKRVVRTDEVELLDVIRGGRGIDYRNKHNGGNQYR
jgi:hypothetical protein